MGTADRIVGRRGHRAFAQLSRNCCKLLQRAGKGCVDGENFEFDNLAYNSEELVVVAVRTTLKPYDEKEFQAKMKKFRTYLPNFHYSQIMGWVVFAC